MASSKENKTGSQAGSTWPAIGIADKDLQKLADGLAELLSDTFTLFVKTQGYHWNVTGPHFNSLHAMFEEQYIELRDAADVIAERIRALGAPAPGSFSEFLQLASIKDRTEVAAAMDMVRVLADDHEAVIRAARPLVELAEKAGDSATADLVTERIRAHEMTAWMLRATAA